MRPGKLTFILLLFFSVSYGQRSNIWYFGREAGLDFNQPGPAPLFNSGMNANEGTSAICDPAGRLQFYTNGVNVYNKQHRVMLNGNDIGGHISATQGCLIIPAPGNDSLFYIFLTDAIENNFVLGYRYAIVNINRDGGNGEVITKNVLLSASCTERLTAARHRNGIDVWIITNDNSSATFRAWLLNCTGLQPAAVVSTTGLVMDQHYNTNGGYMKISPDGKQLCQTHFPHFLTETPSPNFIQLFDFDNATGIVSNPKTVFPASAAYFGCEFSADSRFLYLSRPYDNHIDQVEATLSTPVAIAASNVSLASARPIFSIQLGPDEKIYGFAAGNTISVINNPGVKGTGCNLVQDQINLAPKSSFIGAPAFINDVAYDANNSFSFTIIDSCSGKVQFNGVSSMSGNITWEWDFGDGNTSSLQNPLHVYATPTQPYPVKLKITSSAACGSIERSRSVFPGGVNISADFDFTALCDSGLVRFSNQTTVVPGASGVRFHWDFGDGNQSTDFNPIHSYAPGLYDIRLTVQTTTPCLNRVVTHSVNMDKPVISVTDDTEIDAGESVQLNVTGTGITYLWTPDKWISATHLPNPVVTPQTSTLYYVTVTNEAGCKARDSVFIKVIAEPGVYVPTAFTPNGDGLNDVFKPTLTYEYSLQEFSIYNRWGQKVFSTRQKDTGWDGSLNGYKQDTGSYIWVIKAIDNRTGENYFRRGSFAVIR